MSFRNAVKQVLMASPGLWLGLRSGFRKLAHQDEPELAMLGLLVDPTRTAIDIGANKGVYTQRLIGLAKSVIAVEPNPVCAGELNRLFGSRIRLKRVALSDSDGEAELVIPHIGKKDVTGLGTIDRENPVFATEGQRVRVPVTTLDKLIGEEPVGFIKIDVEGHEGHVLDGAVNTLRRSRPVLLIETENRHHAGAVEAIRDRLAGLGYTGLFLQDGVMRSMSVFDAATHQSADAVEELVRTGETLRPYYNNFIFLPGGLAP